MSHNWVIFNGGIQAIKCETYWLDGENWILGWDTKYLEDVKDAIKGVVGGY